MMSAGRPGGSNAAEANVSKWCRLQGTKSTAVPYAKDTEAVALCKVVEPPPQSDGRRRVPTALEAGASKQRSLGVVEAASGVRSF